MVALVVLAAALLALLGFGFGGGGGGGGGGPCCLAAAALTVAPAPSSLPPLGDPLGELVGGGGRIGSLMQELGGGRLALPSRDGPFGALSPPGTPIVVAAPASVSCEF